jgi:uncharacterized protein (DUF4415 family)
MAKRKRVDPSDYADKPVDDDDNPEWTDEDFARARPFKEVFPEQYAALMRQGGRPRLASPKVQIGFRLSQDVVDRIRASGDGYNARVEKVLREAIEAGRF